ncbi:MAG: hypothetical protein WDN28_12665 [Chthoniobacter sp.]
MHLFLTVITCGLWLVSWASIFLGHQLRPWRCPQCGGHKPLSPERKSAASAVSLRTGD